MRYIEALEEYTPLMDENKLTEKSIFLAGGITNCPDWQQELRNMLYDCNLAILNPRRKNFPINDPNASKEQISWEFNHFKIADIISFWFSRGSLNPIVLFELGKWLSQKRKPIFIGIDPKYKRKQDIIIQTALERPDIKIVFSLHELAHQIKKYFYKLNL